MPRPRKTQPVATAPLAVASKPSSFDPTHILDDLAQRIRDVRLEALPDFVLALEEATSPRGKPGAADDVLKSLAKKVSELAVAGSKLDAIQRAVVMHALAECGGNVSAAARLLGVERKALERRVARYRRGLSGDES